MSSLTGFLTRAQADFRLTPMHVSLYVVLLDLCEGLERPGLFAIYREEVMTKAKIRGCNTYYKLLKELSEWGYVVYLSEKHKGRSKVGIVGG